MPTWLSMSAPSPYAKFHGNMGAPMCYCVCVSHSPSLCSHTLFRMCTCISTWIYIPQLPMHGPTLGIVSWKLGCPYFSLCGCVCPSHPTCGPTPFLECVHASVDEFMYIWLPMSDASPMHSLMETWVPLYGSVFVSQVSHFCSHTLFRMCTCISTCIYIHFTPHIRSTPYV